VVGSLVGSFVGAVCRMWHSWTAIAGNNFVGIIVVFIIREDLEGVVVQSAVGA
jgi:hypothetical protein